MVSKNDKFLLLNRLVYFNFCLLFLFLSIKGYSENPSFYPHIDNLDGRKDAMFKQFDADVSANKMETARGNQPFLMFYTYNTKDDDDLMAISARCSLLQETIATVNHISSPHEDLKGRRLFLPTCDGIFMVESPKTPFEQILKKNCFKSNEETCYTVNVDGEDFTFFPGKRVGATERYFFLDSSLKMPLRESVLTSNYGMRISPITGKQKFHTGVDLAAPEGSDVFACGHGVVYKTGWDNVYGNFVIVQHDSDLSSFYAHLSKILVKKGDVVGNNFCIGKIGTTGASTGPHLHFEIRKKDSKIDPFSVISDK